MLSSMDCMTTLLINLSYALHLLVVKMSLILKIACRKRRTEEMKD